MKKFRQISTKAHRTGYRGKNKRTRSAARGREKAVHLLLKPRDEVTAIPRVDAKKQASSQRNHPAACEQFKTALQDFAVSCEVAPCHEKAPLLSHFTLAVLR